MTARKMEANEYRPWESMGISEVAYWKKRYIEARQELAEPAPGVEPVGGWEIEHSDVRWKNFGEASHTFDHEELAQWIEAYNRRFYRQGDDE